jgi:molybdopterin-guanine dinucleotide biosynthesis protein B
MSDADIVVCEGFKRSELPKIEVFRQAAHRAPLYDPANDSARHYLAIVADTDVPAATVPVIRLEDGTWLEALADLVEGRIMNRHERS